MLLNNYKIVLAKHTNYITDQRLVNPRNPTKCALRAKNRKRRYVKHDIIYAFCMVIKTATYMYLMS